MLSLIEWRVPCPLGKTETIEKSILTKLPPVKTGVPPIPYLLGIYFTESAL